MGVKKFRGGIPNGNDWKYAGLLDAEEGMRYMAYVKETVAKDGRSTGYCYVKLVLEPGKKWFKGNYWISVNRETLHIVRNSDLGKMHEHNKRLIESLDEFIGLVLPEFIDV